MRKLLLSAILIAVCQFPSFSQDVELALEARGGLLVDGQPSFFLDNVTLVTQGTISDGFSFLWKQRLTRPLVGEQPLNGADQLKLMYNTGNWQFSAGKQVLEFGCLEYDAPPIDLHFTTEFYSNLCVYVLGVSAARTFGNYKLIGQISRSPYATFNSPAENAMFAFNLCLHSAYGKFWVPHYSVNIIEVSPKTYSFHYSFGNRFELTSWLALELDLINRSKPGEVNFMRDWSGVAYASVRPLEWLELMFKATYDKNDLWQGSPIPFGTSVLKVGTGAYFFPTKDRKSVRFHYYLYNYSNTTCFQLGITIKPTLIRYSFKKK
ncbi:MAG: hypothetical protein MJY89_03650 [Bacteroidales bacterium]|nr:hypothetical protein [Bacteroidales bacterium]